MRCLTTAKIERRRGSRAQAYHCLQQVVLHKHAITAALEAVSAARDRPQIQNLCYTTLRSYFALRALLNDKLLEKPLKAKEQDLELLLLMGIAEILYTAAAPHAIVSESVELAHKIKKEWAKGLINGILRKVLREKETLLETMKTYNNCPSWLVKVLKRAWPNEYEKILQAYDTPPTMTLRVNQQQTNRDHYLEQLKHAGVDAGPCPSGPDGIALEKPVDVSQLPGFAEGLCAVQDPAAQHVVELMDLAPGLTVLDPCCAPGGKSAHMLEREPSIKLTIADLSEQRLDKTLEGFTRLQLPQPIAHCADASEPDLWLAAGQQFDRILIDAPCSATGVIHRHPDIKILRQRLDIEQLAQLQVKILQALWPRLKVGGKMIYATCSVVPQENSDAIMRFSEQTPDLQIDPVSLPLGQACEAGWQVLPGQAAMDGFYYACLRKE